MLPQSPILSVTQLNRQIRSWLEHEVGHVYVEGEISTLSKPSSGHFYFTLKDATAQVRCVFFRNRHTTDTPTMLQTGKQVVIFGQLSLYEARGDYQLIVDQVEPAGQGDLFRQFELLKTKLNALGLFDPSRKKSLPRFPETIGIVTSPNAAALHDILTTLERRYPIASIIIYPSDVQGAQAPQQLIAALQRANQDNRCDVLILARGGGSIEDLWAFNHEQLAHVIARSEIPIVSGVGHETDFTIADFVSDYRAATPTAAAEAVSPHQIELLANIEVFHSRLHHAIKRLLQHQHVRLQHELQKLSSPNRLVRSHWQTLDYLQHHLFTALRQQLSHKTHLCQTLTLQLYALNPLLFIRSQTQRVQHLEEALIQQIQQLCQQKKQQLHMLLATLHAVSPLATLNRGYAIAMHDHHVLLNSQQVSPGDRVDIRLARGVLACEVITHTFSDSNRSC